jgi:N-acetyl sugar amidotransferase
MGIWDDSVPGIKYDKYGVSNYASLFNKLAELYPRGEKGEIEWNNWINRIKKDGKNKKYDCIIGISGGTDSSYLLHLSRQYNLRPLAVNLDNGWSSQIAVRNIKKMTNALSIDLETYVINYEEVKAVLRAFIKATLPWIDAPTDLAIKSLLYIIAVREGVNYILNGSDFRSEGKQPTKWTYSDAKQFKYIVSKFEHVHLKSFPLVNLQQLINYSILKKIKMLRPYYYIDYHKRNAQDFLQKHYGWEYYGGHHHENLFTKFTIAYWLPKKFGIDKRIITLSSQIMSGEISREQALQEIESSAYDPIEIERDKNLVLKKLDLNENDFNEFWNKPNKYYYDYPSYMPIFKKYNKISQSFFKYVLPFTPSIFIENDIINR